MFVLLTDIDPDEEAREALRKKVLHLISCSFDLTAYLISELTCALAIGTRSQQRAASGSTFYAAGMGRCASNDRWWRQWQQ